MDIPRMQVGDVASRFLVRRLRETKAQFNDDSDGRQRKPWEASDGPVRAHNPKVGGSNPPPATKSMEEGGEAGAKAPAYGRPPVRSCERL